MTIWFCLEHEATGFETGKQPPHFCKVAYWLQGRGHGNTCRIQKMRLVPDDPSICEICGATVTEDA